MVAVVGGPTERELAEVARADDHAALFVGDVHKDLGALARLGVLVGDVVDRLVMADVGKVQAHGVADIDLAQVGAERLGELGGVVVGAVGRAEAGHGHADDAGAVDAQKVEGARCHEQRERRVEAARDADDGARSMGVLQALGQTMGLDVEDVLAALGAAGGVGRDEGLGVDVAGEAGLLLREREAHDVVGTLDGARRDVEGGHAATLGGKLAHVELGDGAAVAEGLGLGEYAAVLGNEVVTREHDVLRGLAGARARVDITADQARGLAGDEAAAVVGLADDGVGRREVADHRGAGLRVGNRGRLGYPKVLAELDGNAELGQLFAGKELRSAKGNIELARDVHGHDVGGAANEVTSLIELVVSRKVTLGHDAQDSARSDGGRAVVELGVDADRQAHEQQRVQVGGSLREVGKALFGSGKKGVLPKEVLAGVGREAQLGQHDDHRAVLGAGPACGLDARVDIEGDVRDAHLGRYRRDLNESVLHPVPPCGRRGATCKPRRGLSFFRSKSNASRQSQCDK